MCASVIILLTLCSAKIREKFHRTTMIFPNFYFPTAIYLSFLEFRIGIYNKKGNYTMFNENMVIYV